MLKRIRFFIGFVDLMNIKDTHRLSEPVLAGDVGTGFHFAFPFNTIEDVVVFDRKHIGVLDDNNFPFSVGRHAGAGKPDDNEFIIIELDQPWPTAGIAVPEAGSSKDHLAVTQW